MPEPGSGMTPDALPRARIIDGRAAAAGVRAEVARQVAVLAARHQVTPGLAVGHAIGRIGCSTTALK